MKNRQVTNILSKMRLSSVSSARSCSLYLWLLNPDRRFSVLLHDFQCRWRSTYPCSVLCLHVHESRQAWPCPCLQYLWAIIAGLMMGPFMIPWFLGGGIIAELSMCGKNAYHDIKRVSISWVITALVRAAHGMSEIWFFRDAFLATGVSEQQVQVRPSITLIRSSYFEPGCHRYSGRSAV